MLPGLLRPVLSTTLGVVGSSVNCPCAKDLPPLPKLGSSVPFRVVARQGKTRVKIGATFAYHDDLAIGLEHDPVSEVGGGTKVGSDFAVAASENHISMCDSAAHQPEALALATAEPARPARLIWVGERADPDRGSRGCAVAVLLGGLL
jgi:hypothetical protein